MGKMTRIAEIASAELVMPAWLCSPWSGFVDELDGRGHDEGVQEIAVGAVAAAAGRVVEFAGEGFELDLGFGLGGEGLGVYARVSAARRG